MPQTRKSVVWVEPEKIELVEKNIPQLNDGEVLLKVESCAICGSDLRILKHGNARVAPGQIVGHEIAGIVEQSNSKKFKTGDRISVGADVPCGKCEHCLNGRANCCDINYAIGHQFEGGFTTYMILNKLTVDIGPVKKMSDKTSYDAAALAEPLACCINGYERALVRENQNIVIFGAGPIGMMLAMLGKVYKAKSITLIDPNQERLETAKKLGIVNNIISPKNSDPVKEVLNLTKNIGADIIFTACPVVETHEQAIAMVAKRGVVNLFGGVPKTSNDIALNSNHLHYKEAYITGSHGSTPEQHSAALDMIESGRINIEPLITHKFPLTQTLDAYRKAASGDAIKVIINPNA